MGKNEYNNVFLQELLGDAETPDYSEQEQAALCGKIPMTVEVFQSCMKACLSARNAAEFMGLFEQFPEYGDIWAEEMRKALDDIAEILGEPSIRIKKLSDEDLQARWTSFRKRVRAELGDEVADSLAEDVFSAP